MQMDSNDGKPWRRLAAISCVTFGLPLLLIREHPWHALCAWLLVVVVYLGLLRLFGTGFVLEGALLAFILACVLASFIHVVHRLQQIRQESREGGTSKRSEAPRDCSSFSEWTARHDGAGSLPNEDGERPGVEPASGRTPANLSDNPTG
jgi:hypothetical protein